VWREFPHRSRDGGGRAGEEARVPMLRPTAVEQDAVDAEVLEGAAVVVRVED
jgi:hypothetical protein